MPRDEQEFLRAEEVPTTCQPPANPAAEGVSKKWNAEQQEFLWDRAALIAAAERWRLAGVARRLWLLADREFVAEALRRGHIEEFAQMLVDGCAGIRVLASQRKLGRLFRCSGTAIDKALLRLESLGLASRGSDWQGTHVVLWVGRLFEAPTVVSARQLRPPEKTVSMGANPVPTGANPARPESEKDLLNKLCAESESESESKPRAKFDSRFWTAKGLPWQRLTDADLDAAIAGEVEILRVLWREQVKLGWMQADQVREFLAVCHHAAMARLSHEYHGKRVDNPAVALVRSRLSNREFRNLSDESYRFADVLLRRMQPTPEAIQQLALSSLRDAENPHGER